MIFSTLTHQMKSYTYPLFCLYIFSIPFTSAFSLSPLFPIPLLTSTLLFILILINGGLRFKARDLWLFSVSFAGIFSLFFAGEKMLSLDFLSMQNISHSLAFFFSIFFYYKIPELCLKRNFSFYKVSKLLAFAIIFSSVFIVLEFFLSNYFSINFSDYLPYSSYVTGVAHVKGSLIRARGFANESGHMSLFYELALPLSVSYVRRLKFVFQALYWVISLVGFVFLFSSAGFVCLSLSTAMVLIPRIYSKKVLKTLLVLSALISFLFISDFTRPYVDGTVLTKISVVDL